MNDPTHKIRIGDRVLATARKGSATDIQQTGIVRETKRNGFTVTLDAQCAFTSRFLSSEIYSFERIPRGTARAPDSEPVDGYGLARIRANPKTGEVEYDDPEPAPDTPDTIGVNIKNGELTADEVTRNHFVMEQVVVMIQQAALAYTVMIGAQEADQKLIIKHLAKCLAATFRLRIMLKEKKAGKPPRLPNPSKAKIRKEVGEMYAGADRIAVNTMMMVQLTRHIGIAASRANRTITWSE